MTLESKKRLIELVRADVRNAGDNLGRAKAAAQGQDTSLAWGQSGRSLRFIIEGYRKWYDEAQALLAEVEAL